MIIVTKGTRNQYRMAIGQKRITLTIGENRFFARYDFLNDHTGYLTDVDPGYFRLMLYVLLFRMDEISLPPYFRCPEGDTPLVSYSGGADSTATLYVTEGKPIHITRSFDLSYENRQIRACRETAAREILTDFEKVSTLFERKHGFSIGIGYTAMFLPLLPLMKTNKIALGVIFDDLAFYYSVPFRFNTEFDHSAIFKVRHVLMMFGIEVSLPLAGYSEIITLQLANRTGISYSSCHTIGSERACMHCYKCFRKQAIQGNPIDLSDPHMKRIILNILKKAPLKMASSTIYAIQRADYKLPEFERYLDIDVSWCERVNYAYTQIFGGTLLSCFECMTTDDLAAISRFVQRINDPEMYRF